jgi:hypothetical protein
MRLSGRRILPVLPPRSMVGQLTLDQHIGVRIPGGQPIGINYLQSDLTDVAAKCGVDSRSHWGSFVR